VKIKIITGVKGISPFGGCGAEPHRPDAVLRGRAHDFIFEGECILKMTVDREVTLRMAKAAQLRVASDDVDRMMDSINDILDFCSLVGELDCSGTPDFAWKMKRLPARRADVVLDWENRDEFKSAAPTIDGNFFRVPKINAES
jgi:aspartyl-tRNA(Asn)/glutamyl-tRNA(Gln) amidotransferase subunit C